MNIQLGLERISAVWWGMWALLFFGTGLFIVFEGQILGGLGLSALVVPTYALHRLTCWVIGGFFAEKS